MRAEVLSRSLTNRICSACAAILVSTAATAEGHAGTEWPTYGHDSGGNRYSPLKQINTDNVARLVPAWTYHMAKTPPGERPRLRSSQVTPLVIGGAMYLSTPYAEAV